MAPKRKWEIWHLDPRGNKLKTTLEGNLWADYGDNRVSIFDSSEDSSPATLLMELERRYYIGLVKV